MSLFVCDVVRFRILDGVFLRCKVCRYEEVVFGCALVAVIVCHESAMVMRGFTRLHFTRYVILESTNIKEH